MRSVAVSGFKTRPRQSCSSCLSSYFSPSGFFSVAWRTIPDSFWL
jgi:hypothetical protein